MSSLLFSGRKTVEKLSRAVFIHTCILSVKIDHKITNVQVITNKPNDSLHHERKDFVVPNKLPRLPKRSE